MQINELLSVKTGPSTSEQNSGNHEWMICVDSVVSTSGSGFLFAIANLFAIFYTLNLQYHTDAEGTLELLQRYLAKLHFTVISMFMCYNSVVRSHMKSVDRTYKF